MIKLYFVNKNAQSGGEHEVHTEDCVYLPAPENRLRLGYFSSPEDVIKEAKKYDDNVDGCYYCCYPVHTR